jgi:hypothetical protein
MKKIVLLLLLPLTLTAQEVDDQLFKIQNDPPPFSPFSLTGSYVDVSTTDFRTPGFEDNSLIFRQWIAGGVYVHPFTPIWGLIFGAGWEGVEVNMQDNPEFNETIFSYVNALIGGYTEAFPDWQWKLTLAAFLDTEDFSFVDYALYQGVLWGKYDLCRWIELDFGFIVESGLNHTKIWPIIGFIYTPSKRWEIDAVFPVDISVNFAFNQCLTASGSLRFLRSRHRVKQDEPDPQGIFEYHTTGCEFDLTYSPFLWLSGTGFVGSTLNGDLKISNRNNHNATHFKFNGSFYAGVSAILSF